MTDLGLKSRPELQLLLSWVDSENGQTTCKRWRKKWSKKKRKNIGGLRDRACEKDWKKLFGLEKIKRHNNGLQVVFTERAAVNYSLWALKIKGVIAVKGNAVLTLKEEFLIIGMMKCWCAQPGEVVELQSPVFFTNRLNKHFQELFWCNQMCLRAMTWARGALSLFNHIFSTQISAFNLELLHTEQDTSIKYLL